MHETGFDTHRMVDALVRRGALLPEVRDHLRALGVPLADQRPLLADRWSADLVDQVLAE